MKLRNDKIAPGAGLKDPSAAAAQLSNTVTRPGPLTTEWWAVVLGGALSSILAGIGLPGSTATQIAGIVAPAVVGVIYALVRSQTKRALTGSLAVALQQPPAGALLEEHAGPPAPTSNAHDASASPSWH